MKHLIAVFSFLLWIGTSIASDSTHVYQYSIDLTRVVGDKIKVTLEVPQQNSETVEFQMPKIVPGTYSISDFGRFVASFRGLDSNKNSLPVTRLDKNRWEIKEAQKLRYISYWVEDTFDSKKDNKIFEPGGTNFEEGKNFTLNPFGVCGYLKGQKDFPFEITFTHAEEHYGASALDKVVLNEKQDKFSAPNYFELSDAPIMYCAPDTATIPVGNAQIQISVFSPNGILSAADVKSSISSTLEAQRKYLGGTLPVDRYAVILYLFAGQSNSGASGALEHSYSTLLCLPEAPLENLAQFLKDVTAHEFFHIVTPLNIHSEHIHDYDFINPSMSQHLWLYEGVTEYAAHHAQVRDGLLTPDQFLDVMREKMLTAQFYKQDLPFTTLSKGALDEHESQYGNVYQKGALIGMSLDLLLLEKSKGTYSLQDLLRELSKEYGKHKPFKDDSLFSIITAKTYPEVGVFLEKFVAGSAPLPFKEVLGYAGVSYYDEKEIRDFNFGQMGFVWDQGGFRVDYTLNPSDFANALKLNVGDVILGVDDQMLEDAPSVGEQLNKVLMSAEEGSKHKLLIQRAGKTKPSKVKFKIGNDNYTREEFWMVLDKKPTAEQQKVREAWLNQ